MAEPLVTVTTVATVSVNVDIGGVTVENTPFHTTLTAAGATPDEAFAKLARFASQFTEAIADAADQYGIE